MDEAVGAASISTIRAAGEMPPSESLRTTSALSVHLRTPAEPQGGETARLDRIALEMLTTLLDEVRRLSGDLRDMSGIATTLMERVTDTSHLTVAEAARFCGVSQKTIRSRIAAGRLTLEIIPGTRRAGIQIAELASGWVRAEQARRLLKARERMKA